MRHSLRQLEVFTAIAGLENVSVAADQLGMSQSAASTALAELERRAGRPLFDRAGKRLRINETGRALLPRALEMLDRAREIDALLEGRIGPGHLNLGASLTIGNYLAPRIVENFRCSHPAATVALDVGNTRNIVARVASFTLDLALIEGEYSHPALIVSDWLEDELAVFCSPAHRLAGLKAVSIDDVLNEQWAVREQGSGTRQTLDRAFVEHWSRWRIGMELEQIEAIKTAVEAGSMIGCVSRLALAEAFESGRLIELKVAGLDLRRRFYTVIHRDKYRTPAIEDFLRACNEGGWMKT